MKCSSGTTCDSCDNVIFTLSGGMCICITGVYKASLNSCVTDCLTGFFADYAVTKTCMPCTVPCATCTTTTITCTSCITGVLNVNVCIASCPLTKYKDANNVCQ